MAYDITKAGYYVITMEDRALERSYATLRSWRGELWKVARLEMGGAVWVSACDERLVARRRLP